MKHSRLTVFILLLLRWSTVATAADSAVPFAEVKILQNGTAIAGDTSFSLICCVTLPQGTQDEEELTVNFSTPATINDTDYSMNRKNDSVIDGSCTYTSVLQFTILKTSHGGEYTCTLTFNSSTMASNTTTVNVQIPTPELTLSRDPNASVTLRHGDPLSLTCTIQLGSAVDSDVVVTGELSGPGGSNGTVVMETMRKYCITQTISSLNTTPSDTYTCNTTIDPAIGVENVLKNTDGYSTLTITVVLFVNISVSYDPPPGVVLGPNEYRAASGPVIVTCTAIGGTGSISYQWSSDCNSSDFQGATSRMITRAAVHSGDTGTHTCTATTPKGVGSASINFTVTGAGIHVFRGIPKGSVSNNGLVSLDPMDLIFRLRFFCRSDSIMEDVGRFIGLDESHIVHSSFFEISNPQPGEISVVNFVANSTNLTASEQGVYTCCIPLQSGETTEINIGIYPSGFATSPQVTNLTFTNESSSSFLTCTSTGSPATTVTWMRDGGPLTIDGNTYQLTQTVINRAESSYENVLTIKEELSIVVEHCYSCIVSNEIGNASEHLYLTVNPFNVAIMQEDNPTAGRSFSLNCSLTLPQWAKACEEPTIEILNPVNMTDNSFIMIEEMSNGSFKYIKSLKFTALQISHGGKYKCQAGFRLQTTKIETRIIVKISPPTVSVVPADDDLTYAGSSLTLICTIRLDRVLVNLTGITVNNTWTGPHGKLFLDSSHNERINITAATEDGDGVYRSTVVFNHLHISDTGNYSCEAGVSHMSEFTSSSDLVTSQEVIINVEVPVVTVIGIVNSMDGVGTAGKLFSISCMINGTDNLKAKFTFTLTARRNNTSIHGCDTCDNPVVHSFIARASDAGTYVCKVIVASTFLDGPIIAKTTVTLTIQIPTPILKMSRDPDMSVTLRHGDPLNLTCTIKLDPAVDVNVTVTGALREQEIRNLNFDTVKYNSLRIYQINKTIASLEAARSTVYICIATVSPGPGVVNLNIIASEMMFIMLNITIELAVTITVFYDPPPGVMLGDSEYRAASGPVMVTCIAVGGIPPLQYMYQWSSTCRDCPFQESNPKSKKSLIMRAAVHSGDTGIHTCTATDTTGNTGNNSTSFTITGAGIHVFNGIPKGSFLNNELVVSDDSDSNFHLRFFCRSDSMRNNSGELIGLNNHTLTSRHPFNISTPQPGELLVFVDSHTHLTPSHQGVYTCHISMQNGDIKEMNIGIYPSGFKRAPTVTYVIYRLERSSSDITCNSITSPPSNVTWALADAMFTLRDGESVTINRVKYELKQTITNRTTSAYASTLIINTTLAGDTTGYVCTVNNALGSDTKTVGEGTFSISIFPSGSQTAGESYTLTCSIAVAKGVIDTLTAHWSGPGMHMEGVTATNVSTQTLGNSSTFILDLTFTPLRQSHDGDYRCTADLATFTNSYNIGILTTVPLMEVHISGGGVAKFGESLILHCTISGVDKLNGMITFQWRGPSRTRVESASPWLVLSTVSFSDAGIYTCTATVSSPYLNDDILESDTVNVTVQVPSPKVAIEHDSRSTINAGSVLVLYCTITMDRRVAQNKQLIVTNTWTGPHGELQNETRITVVQAHGTNGQYSNNVTFNRTHVGDSGNYTCQANVSHQASQFIIQGMNANVTTITVQAPNVSLSLTPNTTRLPNVHPYNTFSLTCTATAPEGVVSPKTFTWWRRNAVTNNNLAQIHPSETIQINSSTLDQPMSTSVLTVTETAAGTYHFQCQLDLVELGVHDMSNKYTISVTNFSLSTIITGETNPLAAEKYTLTCMVTVTEGVPDNLTAHWSGPGVGMDGVTASDISTETQAAGSTSNSDLTFNPLRQSHDGNYNCTASLTTVSITSSSQRTISATTPSVTVMTSNSTGDVVLGERYYLNCTVSGVDNLDGTIDIQWSNSSNHAVASGTGKHLPLVLMKLELSDAGQYTCNTTVTSPYIRNRITDESIEELYISIPRPSVIAAHDRGSNIYAGSVLTLTCTITLDGLVAQNEALMVNNTWTGPSNETITSTARIAVTYPSSTSAQYLSTIKFQTLREHDTGNYSCCATVSHKSIQYVQDGTSANSTILDVQAPWVVLTLISNTTRLPNVPPYNTFSLTCTATAPEGVISQKTFMWWRQNAVLNNSLARIYYNETIQVINSTLYQPMSTSVLTVTETTAGNWYYHCNVTLMDLTIVANKADLHLIHVTGPASPKPPVDLLTDSVMAASVTISWSVSTITFTPETYVVHYGTNMLTLDSMSDPIELSNFTAMNNNISITLDDLIPNTVYFYCINLTNSNGSVKSQVANFTTETEVSGVPVAAVVGGLAAVLSITVLCIVIAGSVWWLRKNGSNSKFQIRSPNALDTMINVELIAIENTKVEEHNIEATTFQDTVRKSIPVTKFGNHVSSMHMDDWGFEFEYKTISKEPLASHDTSQIPCNKERNRFVNIYPYDFSRVKLKEVEGVEGSDYINASFIDGYAKQNEYIAAQGPLPETVVDFWRMVWEYKLTTIVMLTRCKEGTKFKCQQYWPDELNQTLEPGFNLVVTLTSLLPFVEYEIRKLTVIDASNPSAPALQVTHLHYVVWPDHGVPTDSTSLINFVRRVRKVQPHSAEVPLLVHCSAGVGRTGTFIAIDMEMQRIEAEGVVDIYGCTKKLRARRVFMVQTGTQYVFIHDALNELILCGETDIPAASLLIAINRLGKTVQGKQVTGFEEQFEILGQFCANASEYSYSEATHTHNLPKNRYSATVAGSYNRVHLKYTGAPGSDYINANFIGGYRQRGAYIATQGPLASTVKDFWRMIWEHQSKCIVMLCSEQEEGEESCYPYWPEKQGATETHDKIKVTLLSEEDYGSCIIRKLEVVETNKGATDPAVSEVTQFHFLRWPKYGEPSPPASLLELVENLTRVQMGTGNRAITVMCNDGIGRTGAFICLHAQLERLKAEGVVDIFQFIKSARLSRPGLVQNVGQYVLCHKVLADFMNSFETYANFKELV